MHTRSIFVPGWGGGGRSAYPPDIADPATPTPRDKWKRIGGLGQSQLGSHPDTGLIVTAQLVHRVAIGSAGQYYGLAVL